MTERYKIVVSRVVSEHRTKKDARAALTAYKLKKGEVVVLIDDEKGTRETK